MGFDLSELDSVDLQALRLGAQVMSHKAELAERPRVEVFFTTLQVTVDDELARRKGEPDTKPLVSVDTLPLLAAVEGADPDQTGVGAPPVATEADRQLAAEYLDLLQTNIRLSGPVRQAVRALRDQLGPDY